MQSQQAAGGWKKLPQYARVNMIKHCDAPADRTLRPCMHTASWFKHPHNPAPENGSSGLTAAPRETYTACSSCGT